MTSSGTYAFSPSNADIVLSAFERIQIRAPSLRVEHMMTARRELNYLMVLMGNLQPNLWSVTLTSVPLVNGVSVYSVPLNVVMILDAWITTGQSTPTDANDIYITPISRTEYASFANKLTPGRPTCYWFRRELPQQVALWPVPNQANTFTLNYYACLQMQDAELPGGETPNAPYLWMDTLVAGLAHRLARVYAQSLEAVRKADFDESWKISAAQNTENVSMSISPNISSYYRR